MNSQIRLRHIERQAEGYLELGMPEHALDTLDRLGQWDHLSPTAYYLRGEALRSLDRFDEAIPPLAKAIQLVPDNYIVHLALGWCHKRIGRLDQAVGDLERALSIYPCEAILHYNLACYLSLTGDKTRTLHHLARALAIDPDFGVLVDDEPDFDTMRDDPEFETVLESFV